MNTTSRWPARIALAVSILMFGAIMGTFDAFGAPPGSVPAVLQTTASPSSSSSPSRSPSPSPSEECDIPLPAPPPICPEESESPTASPTPSGSPSPTTPPAERHDSTISIAYSASRSEFSGAVKSDAKCLPKRKVVVRKVRKGPDAIVGKDTTNRRGKWSVAKENARGRYYAKVLKRAYTYLDTAVTCGGARSKTLRVS